MENVPAPSALGMVEHDVIQLAATWKRSRKPSYENPYSPYCSPYILYETSEENLSKYQVILSLVIVSFILIT